MLTESQGCAVLKESFQSAGYDIHDNYRFSEGTIQFSVDGYDPVTRVGSGLVLSIAVYQGMSTKNAK